MPSLQTSPGKNAGAIPNQGVAPSAKKIVEPATASAKKRAAARNTSCTGNDTPTKKQRIKNADPTKIPTCKEELTEADKLMLKLKKEDKTWPQITAAVSVLTGQTYGKSSLRNRHTRIADALTEWKDGDIERMLLVRKKVVEDTEAAVAAFKREAENKIWSDMAMAMAEIGADEYSSGAVEKMYKMEKRLGFPHQSTIETVMSSFSSTPHGNHGDELDDGDDDEGAARDSQGQKDDEIVHSGEDKETDGSGDDDKAKDTGEDDGFEV